MNTINNYLFLILNANENSSKKMIHFAIFMAKETSLVIPIILAVLWLWTYHRKSAFQALLTIILALFLNIIIGLVYFHPRPFMVGFGHTFLKHAAETSFVSDHGIAFFSISISFLITRLRILGTILFILSLFVAWSRIYVGVHYPFDMLGSLILSFLYAYFVHYTWYKLWKSSFRNIENLYRRIFSYPISKGWIKS